MITRRVVMLMSLYRCNGIVLRTYPLGESDRIISFITDTNGKVRAVAKGIRKTKSRIGARLEPGAQVSLLIFQARGDLDIVSQADTINPHKRIREDLDRLTHAASLLEAVDLVSQEGQSDSQLYKMLSGALNALDEADSALIVAAFYWRLLAHEGFEPSLDMCVRCGTTEDLAGFDAPGGGALCRRDAVGSRVSKDAMRLLRMIVDGQVAAALREETTPATFEVEKLATSALESVLERRLKAGRVLDRG
jgi:DNA repair protein RecO (recombination protein O)